MKFTFWRRNKMAASSPTLEGENELAPLPPWWRSFKVWGIGFAAILAGGWLLLPGQQGSADVQYRLEPIQKGNLTVTVTATGVLQPMNQVDVGTEISGTVKQVAVDFNDHVKAGQLLARLDTDQLQARYRQSRAALQLAQARVKDAEATLTEMRGKLQRAQEMERRELCAQEECDSIRASAMRAEAGLASARAQVVQSQAELDANQTALAKADIMSPINGIVLKRQIEPGQTVAASLQTPVLFTLAESLAQMELHVAIDEADIGQIAEDQQAVFTVDAYPARSFAARIKQVRYAPQTVDGVVTYETVLTVDNTDLALRPGMTATADITVSRLQDVLLVPNTALRFTPPRPSGAQTSGGLLQRLIVGGRPRRDDQASRRKAVNGHGRPQQVWVLKDGQPVAVTITTGVSDGRMTEVIDAPLPVGSQVVVDATTGASR
ncbi:MAG: efflux RND transporter periplasmic adaptor subunit [Gammaproteobacteria bacterium]|nr:efflux RND transporter periplasmic adaptor subunit [Gammaproteobacteria bacterium]